MRPDSHSIQPPEADRPAQVEFREILPADLPTADARVERARWATARTKKVDQVLADWTEEPDLVRVFEDPKLGRAELVMLRKDRYDRLVKLLHDLASGQAAIRVELDGLAKVQVALQSAVERSDRDPLLESLVGLVANFVGSIRSSVLLVNRGVGTQASPADETTLEFLRREEEAEREIDESTRSSTEPGAG